MWDYGSARSELNYTPQDDSADHTDDIRDDVTALSPHSERRLAHRT